MTDITEQELQSLRNLGNEYERAADEIERLRAKLEWMPDGPDGIDCRNETIKLQDENVARLRARVAELERQIDAATDVICDLGGELREPDMIESQRVREDLRARVAELLSTIRKVAQALEWHAHGRCRGLDDEGPMSSADAVALAERVISASDAGLEAKLSADSREIEDLRARVAMLEADENAGRAITAMPIQIGDDLCYLPVNAHGIVKRAMAAVSMRQSDKTIERMTSLLVLDAVCPCCEELRACIEGCTFATDAPIEHERMMDARRALYGD